ncbi:alanyl-tRNA editing protein Aarsd1 isoform X3 [Cavia porcellus]|uniref:alanyl-tRNA editing protein Aarsd1 isoform X3 n=1 Tax=Cavia porcellus TaxID=10141 RepID=UPI000C87C906|nr:alanyl-tRNA editing protein Aarsd1 isoform X3 [Cavia porcellus]
MAFQCQRDSYAREFSTVVVACCPTELPALAGEDPKAARRGFRVVLEDTLLFPEGGGQPDDRGTIDDVPVLRVTRRGAEADHFTEMPLAPGSQVCVRVDWERRFDHMQQHSGQHLITAVAEQLFGLKTTSWELGRLRSAIELDSPSVTAEQVAAIEQSVNEKIRARLMIIKILGTEKGKKNKTNLLFLAGQRVLKWVERSHESEKALTSLLKCGAEDHVQVVTKLQSSVKLLQKNNLNLLRDLAVHVARSLRADPDWGGVVALHRKDGDSEFMNIIANEVGAEDTLLFLTVGDEKGAGLFLLAGPPETVETLGPRVAEVLEGKGAGKKGRYQGKAAKMGRRMEAQALLQKHARLRGLEG